VEAARALIETGRPRHAAPQNATSDKEVAA